MYALAEQARDGPARWIRVIDVTHVRTGRRKCQGVVDRGADTFHVVGGQERLAWPLTSELKDQQHGLPESLVRQALRRRLAETSGRETAVDFAFASRICIVLHAQV